MPTKLMNKGTKLINKGTKLIWRAEQQCRRAHFSSSCSVNSGGGPAHVGACLLHKQYWCPPMVGFGWREFHCFVCKPPPEDESILQVSYTSWDCIQAPSSLFLESDC
ncbi:hypothetical protein Dimus_031656, partial [Dionaea muscipula]